MYDIKIIRQTISVRCDAPCTRSSYLQYHTICHHHGLIIIPLIMFTHDKHYNYAITGTFSTQRYISHLQYNIVCFFAFRSHMSLSSCEIYTWTVFSSITKQLIIVLRLVFDYSLLLLTGVFLLHITEQYTILELCLGDQRDMVDLHRL